MLSVTKVEKLIGFPPGACGNDKLFLISDKLKHAGMTFINSYNYQNIDKDLSGYLVVLIIFMS